MADWRDIPNGSIEPDAPARSIDAFAFRDNPIAIAEGAPGAPRIQDSALSTDVTSEGTDWVLARTAEASVGAVGTYAYLRRNSNAAPGSTVSGSNLTYAGGLNNVSADGSGAAVENFSFQAGSSSSPSGTWRAMGRIQSSSSSNVSESVSAATLWLRIS